jgi:hypothetical protein
MMGRRLRTPEFQTATADYSVTWDNPHRRSVETDLPPVLSSVWAHPTRDVAAVSLTNWTRKTCAGVLDLNETDMPGTPSTFEPAVDTGLPPIELTGNGELQISIPQLSTVVIEIV